MTASAKFADLLLPGISMFEEENITKPWEFTEFLGFNNKVIEPLYECKTEYEWIRELAKGDRQKKNLQKAVITASGWVIFMKIFAPANRSSRYDEFREKGIYQFEEGHYPFPLKRSKDPKHYPFPHTKRKDRAVFHQIMENSYEKISCRLFPGT